MQLLYHSSQWGDAVSLQIPAGSFTQLYTQFCLQDPGERGNHGKGRLSWSRLDLYRWCIQRCWGSWLLSLWGYCHLSDIQGNSPIIWKKKKDFQLSGKEILDAYWAALVKVKAPGKRLFTSPQACWTTVSRLGLTAQGRYQQMRGC